MLKLTKLFSVAIAVFLALSISSCGDGAKVGSSGAIDVSTSIPSNATGVFLINANQLMEKADFEALKGTDFFKEWLAEAEKENPEMVPFLKDPESSGINLGGNMGFYFTIGKDFMKNNGDMEAALILPIGDKAKFDAALKLALKDKPDAKTEAKDGYSITIGKEGKSNLIQSDKIFAVTSFSDDEKIKNLINGTGDNIKSNASFTKHLKEGKDIMFWMGADAIVEAALSSPMTAMALKGGMAGAQIPEEGLKGNSLSFYYDFENGEIDGGAAFDFSQALKDELGELFPEKLAVDYSKYIPAENLAAAVSFGVSTGGLLNFVSKRGYDKQADQMLAIAGLNLGQIKDGISGDLAAGVYPPATDGADPVLVFALGLKDKAFMEDLIKKFGPMAGVTQEGDRYTMTGGQPMDPSEAPMKMFASIQGDVIVISNDVAQLDKALAGNTNAAVAELQEGWMGIFLDYALIEKNQDAIAKIIPTDPGNLAMTKMMSQYNELSTAKILMKGDKVDAKMGLKTTDMNSLKRLIQVADMMFKDREKIKAEIEKHTEDEFGGFDDEFEENT